MADVPTTQRAYTLRLRGIDPKDHTWRDALWATHEAVNKGAKVFGEWLLTLRGGLDHRLAEEPELTTDSIDREWNDLKKKAKDKGQAEPSREDAERSAEQKRIDRIRVKRTLLALSWLSVEDERGAGLDSNLIVAFGDDCKRSKDKQDSRDRKVEEALRDILCKRGLSKTEVDEWNLDCEGALKARIRDDAVWVNRSAAFDALTHRCPTLTRNEVWDFLEPFFVSPDAYLQSADGKSDNADGAGEEKAKDLVIKAGGWLSRRAGAGSGTDFERLSRAYEAIADWTKIASIGKPGNELLSALARHLGQTGFVPSTDDSAGVLSVISGPGYKSATRNQIAVINDRAKASQDDLDKLAELARTDAQLSKSKIGGKGPRPYADMMLRQVEAACEFTYRQQDGPARHCEFSVMLDHAARRVNVAHSWIKNAEAERRQFESDSQRLAKVPAAALQWLLTYRGVRGEAGGSLETYRIRKRAIDAWDKVVDRWSRADCQSTEDRVAAARSLQDDDPDIKFGDIQLFEALAADDAVCVWKPDGAPTSQPLRDFVAATEAEAKKRRFKVPAYRHPDALSHPVFTDFGNSRWGIDFSAHRAPNQLGDLQEKVRRLKASFSEAERRLSNATPKQRETRKAKVAACRESLQKAEHDLEQLGDRQRLTLDLWNNRAVAVKSLRWSCKRLVADLNLHATDDSSSQSPINVPRADRLGHAAAGADESSRVSVSGLFQQEHWNGRLQAPRAQLDAIARHVDKHGWDEKARKMIGRIRWLVSFSAELTQQGPWFDFCARFGDDAHARPFISGKGEYAVKHRDNDQRKGHAKLILSRLPGLRLLSVDLGHRYAAACAVWEAITQEQMRQACKDAGSPLPESSDMYVHLKSQNAAGKRVTTIYRRIGPDAILDQTPHPAPWARLDRQFLIKLQGEDLPARKASSNELQAVKEFEEWVGLKHSDDDPPRDLAVDALMSDAVRTARLALARHGRRARIASNLVATERKLPGRRTRAFRDDADRIEFLQETLADWHALASDSRWDDQQARSVWNQHLAVLKEGFAIDPPSEATPIDERPTKAERRQADQELRQCLMPLVQSLLGNESLRQTIHREWSERRWSIDDSQWQKKLKWLSRWLMPRGGSRRDASRRHVGGLSLTRIGTLTEFRRKVQVGFYTRENSDGNRVNGDLKPRFGQSTLDAIQRLKDQRIKQLASRIVEAALGVGIEQNRLLDDSKKKQRDLKRPRQRINDPRFAPCHAVVIEDLEHYRPEETRTRRENRATMDWKSAETRKRLEDHCQLYGLHLRDVNPQYTSHQDSRTGAPGVRCVDVSVVDFLRKPWWRGQVARAQKKALENKGDARARYLAALAERWSNAPEEEKAKSTLRIPNRGGEIFVSVSPESPVAAGIQADLNAAANIGLRALLDPEFNGRWWYVPCVLSNQGYRIPNPEKCAGARCLTDWSMGTTRDGFERDGSSIDVANDEQVREASVKVENAEATLKAAKEALKRVKRSKNGPAIEEAEKTKTDAENSLKQEKAEKKRLEKAAKTRLHVNLWRDPSNSSLAEGVWRIWEHYENCLHQRVLQILSKEHPH
jgi:IS605 OrfB family transposase